MEGKTSLLRRVAPVLVLAVVIPLAVWFAANGLGGRAGEEELRLTEQSVRRAAVQCYALEGFYPTGLDYLEEHYGVSIHGERCFVDYQYVASNLMPDITVLPLT